MFVTSRTLQVCALAGLSLWPVNGLAQDGNVPEPLPARANVEPAVAPTPPAPPIVEAPPAPEPTRAAAPPLALEPRAVSGKENATPAKPLAGWHQGVFFLRDQSDNFRLYLQGRLNIDGYAPFGPGVSDLGPGSGLQPTFFLRRARTEVSGELLKTFQYKLEGEWGQSAADNPSGQAGSVNCTVDATGMRTCTNRSAAIGTATQKPATQDAFINYRAGEGFNVEVGQFKIPFGYETRSSENFSPFMESSLPTRALAAPLVRDIGVMLWGELGKGLLFYSGGVFNGDGPNRPNADRRFDVIGRAFVRPLSGGDGPLKGLHLGASGRWGRRDAKLVGYDLASMTTQGGFAFWRPTYTDSVGQFTHIMPSGAQRAIAGEFYLPVSMFDLTSEIVFSSSESREAADGLQLQGFERLGRLKGVAYYVQLGAWVYGDRVVVGKRGYGTPTQLKLDKPDPEPPPHAVEVLVRFEQLRANYGGSIRRGAADAKTPDGDIKVNAGGIGINYWFTKHIRLSANGLVYGFPEAAPTSASKMGGPVQTSRQRAVAPAQTLPKGVNDSARDSGSVLYEAMVRFGFAL